MEKSIKKLVFLLQQVVNDAGFALLQNNGDETRHYCIEQYNKICSRLAELDSDLGAKFQPLSNRASVGMVRVAARDMASQLVDYLREQRRWSSMGIVPGFLGFFTGLEQNGYR